MLEKTCFDAIRPLECIEGKTKFFIHLRIGSVLSDPLPALPRLFQISLCEVLRIALKLLNSISGIRLSRGELRNRPIVYPLRIKLRYKRTLEPSIYHDQEQFIVGVHWAENYTQ